MIRPLQIVVLALSSICLLCQAAEVRADDGAEKWTFRAGSEVTSSPAIAPDGTIYVGSDDGCLYAISSHGTQKWRFKTGGSIISSPAIGPDGTVYVGSGDGRLYAINHDGTLKWAYQTADAVYSSPVLGRDGIIYVASWDHHVYALSPDGLLRWIFETGNGIFSTPAIGRDNTIYVGSSDGKLYAIKGVEEPRARPKDDSQPATEDAFKEIRDIRFEAEEDGEERVVFLLNSVFSPKVLTIDGERPRVICDFAGAHLAGNISREIAVVGARIQYIRTSFYGPDYEGVKVFLEVNREAAGMLKGPFFDEEHVFSGKDGYLYMFILKPDVAKQTEADIAG
ncbi:MAG: PQQ-binding-like beta-propeller repeat protein [Thermodesulfobacteriota bacterium]|nr:PQQ-binding-like beta-propeller repeat protein [Thermodesulfobacteriota bacterium]